MHVSRTVVPERSEDVPVRVANMTDDPVPICAGTVVANLNVTEVCGADELTMPKKKIRSGSGAAEYGEEGGFVCGTRTARSVDGSFDRVFVYLLDG